MYRDLVSAAVLAEAASTGDVELDTVADDLAFDALTQSPHESLYSCVAELRDLAAPGADGVVVVLDARDDIGRRAVGKRELAQDTGFQEQLYRTEDGGPADSRERVADLLRSEAVNLALDGADHLAPGDRGPVSTVFQHCHQV